MNEGSTVLRELPETVLLREELPDFQQEEEEEIDLSELFGLLWAKAHYLMLFALLGALVLNAYSYFLIHPTYEATASIYVVTASGGNVVDLTDLNLGSNLKSDYQELISRYPVLHRVSEELNLGWSMEQMKDAVRISNPTDTRILDLTATARDPQLAMDIANKLAEVSIEYLPVTMSTDAPNVADKARMPLKKANPSYTKYTLLGAALGLFCSAAWIIFQHLTDDTIRTAEDMEQYLGLVSLATVPYVETFHNKERDKERKKDKKFKLKIKLGR